MIWKRGPIVWAPSGDEPWARHSALQPTPLVLDDRIRVYVGVRDDDGRASIAFVDLALDDPTRVLDVAREPVLAPRIGSDDWDRDGVVPTSIVRRADGWYLYYAGYERVDDPLVRFHVFSGLAISRDDGATFTRHDGHGQLLFPCAEAPLFRVIHSIIATADGAWRAWYGGGGEFRRGADKTLPVYDIRHMRSPDGITFPDSGDVALRQLGDEYRVGRPYVVDHGGGRLEMFFGASSEDSPYRLGYATSVDDGASWTRDDAALGELAEPGEWDAQMSAYPALVATPHGRILLYDGDDYGRAGFGIAWERDENT